MTHSINKVKFVLISLLLLATFSGIVSCVSTGPNWNRRFQRMISSYEKIRPKTNLGDDKQNVIGSLEKIQQPFSSGFPGRAMESVTLKNGQKVDIYYMRTSWYPDGLHTDDEFIPYVFVDDKLAAVGWDLLGGPKTTYDPKRVEMYYQAQMAAAEAQLRAIMAIQQMGNNLQRAGMQFQNTYQIQNQTDLQEHHRLIQEQQMRELNRNLRKLNQTLEN